MSHPNCKRTPEGIRHICQQPSGRICVENGCYAEAGTFWGPLWCPDHDAERLDRVSAGFASITAAPGGSGTNDK